MKVSTRPRPAADRARALRLPDRRRWVLLCAAAESVGMAAAATAARVDARWLPDPDTAAQVAAALGVVVAGGLVEGVALGAAQATGLRAWLPPARRRAWLLVTVLFAGLGWAAASAPAVLAGEDDGTTPPLLLVLAGAAGLGVAMGAVLGAVQASVLRGLVPHPWRWVGANVAGWAAAMPVIFLGATSPATTWPTEAVVGLGAVTGAAAGAVLGLVTGWFLPSLTGAAPHDRVVLGVLGSPAHRLLDGDLVGLRLRGAVSGRRMTLPVMYAVDGAGLVVVPGRPERKRWWRNLSGPTAVEVLTDGAWTAGTARVLRPGDAGYDAAVAGYLRRRPRARAAAIGPVVRIEGTR